MPIQAPKEKPATQHEAAFWQVDCSQSERRGGVGELAFATRVAALGAADAAEVEPQGREAKLREHLVQRKHDLVCASSRHAAGGGVQSAAAMVCALDAADVETAFDPPLRPVDDDIRHFVSVARPVLARKIRLTN